MNRVGPLLAHLEPFYFDLLEYQNTQTELEMLEIVMVVDWIRCEINISNHMHGYKEET